MAKVGLISLGCPKNIVDAEEILGEVERAGHKIEADPERAEVLIVNTCGFIQSAKEESIEAILDAVRYKTNGACRSVIVTGCLSQRYGADLAGEIPEADGFLGVGAAKDIAQLISKTMGGAHAIQIGEPRPWWLETRKRVLTTAPWTAYLRVADGCDNRCAYCAIPDIRGAFRSRPEKDIVEEARALAGSGVKELNLVAQDVTRWGLDAEGELVLPRLLDKLSGIDGVHWNRLLYCYPTRVTDELIRAIAKTEKVCKYIDIPLQHCSERVLRAMGRHGSKQEYLDLFARIKSSCPDAALRTTFIVGFPGETEADFEELVDFVDQVRFDRMGVFQYSAEDGTPAAKMKPKIGKRLSAQRFHRLMALQQEISLEKNRSMVGKKLEVLVESLDGETRIGRSYRDALEIDGLVYVTGTLAKPGEFVTVEVTSAEEYDLRANPVFMKLNPEV